MHLRLCRAGTPVVLAQTSPESLGIAALIRILFAHGVDALKSASLAAGVSEDDWNKFLSYCATFIDNSGNYKRCVRECGGYFHFIG